MQSGHLVGAEACGYSPLLPVVCLQSQQEKRFIQIQKLLERQARVIGGKLSQASAPTVIIGLVCLA